MNANANQQPSPWDEPLANLPWQNVVDMVEWDEVPPGTHKIVITKIPKMGSGAPSSLILEFCNVLRRAEHEDSMLVMYTGPAKVISSTMTSDLQENPKGECFWPGDSNVKLENLRTVPVDERVVGGMSNIVSIRFDTRYNSYVIEESDRQQYKR